MGGVGAGSGAGREGWVRGGETGVDARVSHGRGGGVLRLLRLGHDVFVVVVKERPPVQSREHASSSRVLLPRRALGLVVDLLLPALDSPRHPPPPWRPRPLDRE